MKPSNFDLALDMDGVMADILKGVCKMLAENHNEFVEPGELVHYSIKESCKTPYSEIKKYWQDPDFFRGLEPMEGMIDTVNAMLREGWNICVISTCKYGGFDGKIDWLRKHVPKLDMNNVYFTYQHKYRVAADIFVDDHIDNLKQYAKHNPNTSVICYTQPHNSAWDGARVFSWDDLYSRVWDYKLYIEELERARKVNRVQK